MDRISSFTANNNCIKTENKDNKLIINNCWNDSSIRFEFSDNEDLSFLDIIVLPKYQKKYLRSFIKKPTNLNLFFYPCQMNIKEVLITSSSPTHPIV